MRTIVKIAPLVFLPVIFLAGCSSTPNSEPLFTVPSENATVQVENTNSSPQYTLDLLGDKTEEEYAVATVEEVKTLSEYPTNLIEVDDPTKTVQEWGLKKLQTYSTEVNAEKGKGSYSIAVKDIRGIGPQEPLLISIVPNNVPEGTRNNIVETVLMNGMPANKNDIINKDITVDCNKDILGYTPTLIVCTFSDTPPDYSIFQLGVRTSDTNVQAIVIPINPKTEGGQ